jgi:agmatine/peptidylarginine deiminase
MRCFPAEFEKQSFVQIIFPHQQSDWSAYLHEASMTFVTIIKAIAQFQPCLVVCDDVERVKNYFTCKTNIYFVQCATDDTWARDCSGISVRDNGVPKILDFTFNGWGNKFDASLDNAMTSAVSPHYSAEVLPVNFVLEGGSIESNGAGTLLTTAQCLLNPNRNPDYTKSSIEAVLKKELGVTTILWLNHGFLIGDDTDAHIDTLARFVDSNTIMYVACDDENDDHFEELKKMEAELRQFTCKNEGYTLIALPLPKAHYYKTERLPATYANFLMLNGAVLVPTYNDEMDKVAVSIFEKTFPSREIVPIDCCVLIREHGSLHCVTMQFCEKLGTIF